MRAVLYFFALVIISILSPYHSFSVPSSADSISRVLNERKTDDTVKVHFLLQLANLYEMNNPDSVAIFSNRALRLSNDLGYKKGIVNAYEMLGTAYATRGSFDSAFYYYNLSITESKANNLFSQLPSKYNHIGNLYLQMGKYADAHMYYDSTFVWASKYRLEEMKAKAYSNLANVFYKMGNYTRALNNYLQGLKIQEALGAKGSIASDLANISNVYYRLGKYDKAIEYTNLAMVYHKKTGIKERLIGSLTTYAMIYSDRKMYDSSLHYLNEAYKLATEMGSPYLQNILKGNIAECYLKKGDFEQAGKLYGESLELSGKLGDAEGVAIAKAGLGDVYTKSGSAQEGRKYLTEAFEMMQQLGIKEQSLDIASKLATSYESAGDYKNALHFSKLKNNLADSLEKQKAREEVEQLLFDHEIQKKEDKIALLQKDNAINEDRNRYQSIFLWSLLAGLVIMSVIAYLFYRSERSVRKSKRVIVRQKDEIQEQSNKLSELNDFKDVTFSLLAHDLRSPVNALASTMMLLDEKIITPEEFVGYKQELNSRLQSVSILLDNMLYWAKSQMKGEFTLEIERLNIKRATLRAISVLNDAAQQKNITVTNTVPEDVWAQGDKDHIDIVIRNLVANAIKFTHEGGEVSLTATTQGNFTSIMIADNGVGMTQEQISRLFSEDISASTKGTEGEKGTGLGLMLCYSLVKRNSGDITVTSKSGEGSTFTIQLPAA